LWKMKNVRPGERSGSDSIADPPRSRPGT
jgi:hypothetical protein